ncbi:MAG TPA: MBL fold metallo-hydrolase [Bryobacteraceae bacterium]|jgi:glyoxylase-like metal-dependent hydrolase (beta-lactamase superfamily II)|nr:MBL fold metallo-hydrolase [Bryobacteraceae bacterium]
MREIARDVAAIKTLISNAYLVGEPGSWILLDTLTPGNARRIKEAAEARFGPGAKPQCIVLTHGHFDHAGSARSLADYWGVNVYAHRLELPYLTGRSGYPPLDPTAPGFFSAMSRLFPSSTVNLGSRVMILDTDRPLPWVHGWDCHFTPGHSPGHLSFFKKEERILLAGDAVTTMNLDSLFDTLATRQQICRPPVPGTTNWIQARESVRKLAALRPDVIGAGHGKPMFHTANELETFAQYFTIPASGRYVNEPVLADESGIKYVPPPAPDLVPKIAGGVFAAAIGAALLRKRRS